MLTLMEVSLGFELRSVADCSDGKYAELFYSEAVISVGTDMG